MMFIQMRFTIILYTRALNAIRGHFLKPDTLSFRLPSNPNKLPYYERGNYIQYAVAGMALVNSGYIGLGLYSLIRWPHSAFARACVFFVVGLVLLLLHMLYYRNQAQRRESHSQGSRVLKWEK